MGEKNEVIRIGHYILGRTIGTGGYAKVKEAQHDLTGVKVAIKIINKRKMRNKNMISKVKREIKILKFINHPNIIKLYEVLDTTNDIFAIMQLASQGELYDYIQANDIDQPLAKFFFKQILSGVQYIHQNLIAHRDLKPENILMDSNGLIKIVDFGLSNLMKDGKLLKTACGSPNYAAPEIVGERKYEGTSVDIWSCGVILYTLIVGSFPFEEQTAFLLYKKIEQGNYTIPSTVSPVAADLISRMLQVDPCKRIKIYQIKNHPWLRFKVPIYCKISSAFNLEKESQFQLDRDIFEQAKKLTSQSIDEVGEEKLIKSIKKRDDESFVITYELMKDEKYRLQDAEESLRKFRTETHPNTILEEVDNIIGASVPAPQDIIVYGRRYSKSPKVLAEAVILALKNLCFEFAIKNADYCIKCVYVPFIYKRMSRNPRGNDSELDEHNEKELKFSKKEIKFTLQIYSANAKTFQHLIDLQLTQGHPLVFVSVAQKLYDMITKLTS